MEDSYKLDNLYDNISESLNSSGDSNSKLNVPMEYNIFFRKNT